MKHVFISYKRDDRSFVDELENRIIDADMETWSDTQLRAGESWRQKIDEAIEDSFAVVVVMTPEARQSEYVTYEWSFAMGMQIPIIPIMLKKTELHPKLNDLHFLDFTDRYGEPWNDLIDRLAEIKLNPPSFSITIPRDATHALRNAVNDLNSSDSEIREKGLRSLRIMNNEQAKDALAQAIYHDYQDVRVLAGWYLANAYKDIRCFPALIEALRGTGLDIEGFSGQYMVEKMLIEFSNSNLSAQLVQLLDDKDIGSTVKNILKKRDDGAVWTGKALINGSITRKDLALEILVDEFEPDLNISDEILDLLIEIASNEKVNSVEKLTYLKIPTNIASHYARQILRNYPETVAPILLDILKKDNTINIGLILVMLLDLEMKQFDINEIIIQKLIELLDDKRVLVRTGRKPIGDERALADLFVVDKKEHKSMGAYGGKDNDDTSDKTYISYFAFELLHNLLDESLPNLIQALLNHEIKQTDYILRLLKYSDSDEAKSVIQKWEKDRNE